MQTHVIFEYHPPCPATGLAEQDMTTIYSRKANPQEIPEEDEIVGLPTEELDLPTSNIKEQQGESEMRFKVLTSITVPIPRLQEEGSRPKKLPSLLLTLMRNG